MGRFHALCGAALFAASAGTAAAQDGERGELDRLRLALDEVRRAQDALANENCALRREVAAMRDSQTAAEAVVAEARLEEQVNRVAASARGVEVRSKASALTLTGEFRFRTVAASAEVDGLELDGYWTDARVRTGFRYDFARDVAAFVELQSHWAFGDGAATSGGFGSPFASPYAVGSGESTTDVELYQGWAEVRDVFGQKGLRYRVGRQEIVLGNQFQFGNADWYSGWSFDAMRVDFENEDVALTGFAFKGASGDRDVAQFHSVASAHDDDEVYGLYATLKAVKCLTLDGYWFYVNGHGGSTSGLGGSGSSLGSLGNSVGGAGLALGSTAYFHTLGARAKGVIEGVADGIDWSVEAAFQTGDVNGAGAITDVSGLGVEAELGLTFDAARLFRLYTRWLYSEGAHGDESGYVPLYPSRHGQGDFLARYGTLDVLPMANVISGQIGLTYAPSSDWILGAQGVWATADAPNVLGGVVGDDDYGFEFDLWALYKVSEDFTLVGALILLFPDSEGTALYLVTDDVAVACALQARLTF
jgi:hypothetical protein